MNRKHFILLLLTGVLLAVGAATPGHRKSISESLRPGETTRINKPAQKSAPKKIVVVERDDTIYCGSTLSVGSWQIPLDTMTYEEALTAPFVVRLTNKNKKGHFGRVEVFRKGLMPTVYEGNPGILNDTPDSLHCKNLPVLNSIHRIDYISDSEGDMAVQERMYDIGNQLIAYVTSTKINEDPLIYYETYYNSSGLPLDMAKTPEGKSLRTVVVYDDDRLSRVVWLFDGTQNVNLKDGSWGKVITFLPEERAECVAKVSTEMKPGISNAGYAAEKTHYSQKMLVDSIVYTDANGQAMIVQDNDIEPHLSGISKMVFKYKNGLISEQTYYGLNNTPVENKFGTHRIALQFDDYGYRTCVEAFGLDGKPAPCNNNGWSKMTAVLDSTGNTLEYHQYDTAMRPVSSFGEYSSFFNTYTPDGRRTAIYNYIADENGKETLSYSYTETPSGNETHYDDGSISRVIEDNKGRILENRYTDAEGYPDSSLTTPLILYSYLDRPDGSVVTTSKEYDAKGRLRNIYTADSAAYQRIWISYDENGRFTDSNIMKYDSEWSNVTGQTAINQFGQPTRLATSTSPLFYTSVVEKTLSGNYYKLQALDEFGDTDYMVFEDGTVSAYNFYKASYRINFRPLDCNADPIEGMTEFKRITPKYMSIEVIDSVAYKLGLRDNDIILRYGERYYPLPAGTSELRFIGSWAEEETFCTPMEKQISVFRIDSVSPARCSIRTFTLPAGTTRDLGFITHLTYKTPMQQARIHDTLQAAGFDVSDVKSEESPNTIIAAFPNMTSTFRNSRYGEEIGTPAILLSAYIEEFPELRWRHGDDSGMIDKILALVKPTAMSGLNLRLHFYNGKQVKDICVNTQDNPGYLLRFVEWSTSNSRNSLLRDEAEKIDVNKAKPLPRDKRPDIAINLYNQGFYKQAIPLFETLSDEGDATAHSYAATYYDTRSKPNKKKALRYAAKAIASLEAADTCTVEETLLLANMYAIGDSVKAAQFLTDRICNYQPCGIFVNDAHDISELYDRLVEYSDATPEIVRDGRIYTAALMAIINLRYDLIVDRYLMPAYREGHLKAPLYDATSLFYGQLSKAITYYPDREDFKAILDEFIADKIFTFEVVEEPGYPAYERGLRGEYIILRQGDWTMLSDEDWISMNNRTVDSAKHVVLLSPSGEIIEDDYNGKIGAVMKLKSVTPQERERVIEMVKQL